MDDCVSVELRLAGRFSQYLPSNGLQNNFTLHRGGIMLGGRQGAVSSRVFVGPIQTGTGVGYIGIDGESIIYRIQMAEVRWDVSSSVSVTGGIVEDLWVVRQ